MFLPCISTLSLFWFMIRLNELMPVLQISGWTYPYNAPHEKPGRCIQPTSTTTHDMVDWWNNFLPKDKSWEEEGTGLVWRGKQKHLQLDGAETGDFWCDFRFLGWLQPTKKLKERKRRKEEAPVQFSTLGGVENLTLKAPKNIEKIYLEPDGYEFINGISIALDDLESLHGKRLFHDFPIHFKLVVWSSSYSMQAKMAMLQFIYSLFMFISTYYI